MVSSVQGFWKRGEKGLSLIRVKKAGNRGDGFEFRIEGSWFRA
jgi:hypothetical protein